ncbi:hypothetical protein A2635_00190 [Candidatus Peribacteria bacterium RIFCSPHIGHO2_01_FULL_51_9]|nr:MAG: hypothetical protein A2635_00190 [Candidatus Peribacteria bacterium RIFCSPHIGHO2_01_FULL_51_9]
MTHKEQKMRCFMSFHVVCGGCGHRNRPHRSPKRGIRMVLLGEFKHCRNCGKELKILPSDRPLVRAVRVQLVHEGLLSPEE